MAYLSVKLDHVAALRAARRGQKPLPSQAATLAELAGADSITVHMRNDRRHIKEKDVFVLKQTVGTRLTIEVAPTEENLARVLEVKPYMVTFMPEVDREVTTQSGLTLNEDFEIVQEMVQRLQAVEIKVALHIEPDADLVKQAAKMRVDAVKLHTGFYAGARNEEEGLAELGKIERAAKAAGKADLMVIAGQGLDYQNLGPLVKMGVVDEFTIGQAIVAHAVMVGMHQAVRDIMEIIRYEGAGAGA